MFLERKVEHTRPKAHLKTCDIIAWMAYLEDAGLVL